MPIMVEKQQRTVCLEWNEWGQCKMTKFIMGIELLFMYNSSPTIGLGGGKSVLFASHCCFQTILPFPSLKSPILNLIPANETIHSSFSLTSFSDHWVYLLNSLKSLVPDILSLSLTLL